MPENKKQHYISKLLLKKFASDKDKKSFNVYNRKTNTPLLNIPIESQAQKDYFYGKDGDFEKFLGITEDRVAPIIEEIVVKNLLPSFGSQFYSFLLHFIMLYQWRTKANVDKTEEMINEEFVKLARNNPDFKETNYRIKHPEPAAFNLATFMDGWVVTGDLIPYLVKNLTGKEFILSDNPLVTYNPFMQKRECYWAANSILSKGLTMLFPLSPFYCLLFVDSQFYDVKSTEQNLIYLENRRDIDLINLLQTISADNNLYFSSENQTDYVSMMSKQGLEQKKNELTNKIIPNPANSNSFLQLSYTIKHDIKQYFSFLRESKIAKEYKTDGILRHPRNEEIVHWIDKMVHKY